MGFFFYIHKLTHTHSHTFLCFYIQVTRDPVWGIRLESVLSNSRENYSIILRSFSCWNIQHDDISTSPPAVRALELQHRTFCEDLEIIKALTGRSGSLRWEYFIFHTHYIRRQDFVAFLMAFFFFGLQMWNFKPNFLFSVGEKLCDGAFVEKPLGSRWYRSRSREDKCSTIYSLTQERWPFRLRQLYLIPTFTFLVKICRISRTVCVFNRRCSAGEQRESFTM